MAITVIGWEMFARKYPKLANAGQTLIEQALADAQLYVDECAFGVRASLAVEIKAAAILEAMKYGQVAPLPNKTETNEYAKRWDELCVLVPRRMMTL